MEQPINILIVDDEPKNLTVLETVLNDPGYRLVRAEYAEQALLALVAEDFALLILDIRMPGMTGFELAHIIKERKKTANVPIIFLTAYYNEDQHMLEGYGTGAVDFLLKPVNPPVLRSKVAVFAELYRKSRDLAAANHILLAEVAARRQAEEELRQFTGTLELRVAERTEVARSSEELSRQRHAELEIIYQNVPVGLCVIDRELRFLRINEKMANMNGFPAAAHIGQTLRTMAPHLALTLESSFRKVIDTGEPVIDLEVQGVTASEPQLERCWVVSSVPVRSSDGPIIGIGCVVEEVTARKRAESELIHAKAAAEEANSNKDHFLAMLGHELRNPLAPIRNAVTLIDRFGLNDPAQQRMLELIDRQVKHMARLIDDLLDISRIAKGKITLKQDEIDLSAFVLSVVEDNRPQIEARGLKLNFSAPTERLRARCDCERIAQIVSNLLVNASKFTDSGGAVTIELKKEGEQKVLLSVRDTGIGMNSVTLQQIFKPFAQADCSLDRSGGGLGLGLALVKGLVELHGGSISATSAGLGKGSEFTVVLPILIRNTAFLRTGKDTRKLAIKPRQVLVIEDNPDIAETMFLLLKGSGHKVTLAYNGVEGLENARGRRPEVIFCDIGLPGGMNGYDVAIAIRQIPELQSVLLIATSGYGRDEDRQRAKEAGFDKHITKPYDFDELERMLAHS